MNIVERRPDGVSVAMATWNGARYVEEQIESILSQTTPVDELVIVDDCSSDETVHKIEGVAIRSPVPIHIHRNSSRCGVTRAFETAMRATSYSRIFLSDQDDIWMPRKVERLSAMLSGESVVVVFSNAVLIDGDGQVLRGSLWEEVGFQHRTSSDLLEDLLRYNVATGATMALRAEFLEMLLPIPDAVDHDMWLALMAAGMGGLRSVNLAMMAYRLHPTNAVGVTGNAPAALYRKRRRKASPFSRELKAIDAVTSRLSGFGLLKEDVSAALREKESLLAMRESLCTLSLPSGVARIALAILFGRYGRYSHGARSAAWDLCVAGLRLGCTEKPYAFRRLRSLARWRNVGADGK